MPNVPPWLPLAYDEQIAHYTNLWVLRAPSRLEGPVLTGTYRGPDAPRLSFASPLPHDPQHHAGHIQRIRQRYFADLVARYAEGG